MNEKLDNIEKEEEYEIDQLLTSREVATKLRTTLSNLCHMRKKKTGPEYIRFGSHYKYPYKKLIEYMKNRTNA